MSVLLLTFALQAHTLTGLVVPVEIQRPSFTVERIAMVSAAVLDVASTAWVLKQGGREANPLLGKHPSVTKLVTVKLVAMAVQELAARYLTRKGYPNRARFIYWTAIVLWSAVGVSNLTMGQR